jgi:hypothetical protein
MEKKHILALLAGISVVGGLSANNNEDLPIIGADAQVTQARDPLDLPDEVTLGVDESQLAKGIRKPKKEEPVQPVAGVVEQEVSSPVAEKASPDVANTPESEPEAPKLVSIGGYLRPEEIAIPPAIPGYRLYMIDRNVRVPGVLEGGGKFEAILPLYVFYPNSKTINMEQELESALDSLGVIQSEFATLKAYTGSKSTRRLNEHLEKLQRTLDALHAIQEEEISSFSR